MTDDSFAGHPQSLGEIRAASGGDSTQWTPREVLIAMLRQIDDGADIDTLIVCYRQTKEDGQKYARFWHSGDDQLVTLGLLSKATADFAS
jgi:hypothetical protein